MRKIKKRQILKIIRQTVCVVLIAASLGLISFSTVLAEPKVDSTPRKCISDSAILMVATKTAAAEKVSGSKKANSTILPGSIVYADFNSLSSDKILVEYLGNIYSVSSECFKTIVGSNDQVKAIAENIQKEFQKNYKKTLGVLGIRETSKIDSEMKRLKASGVKYPVAEYVWSFLKSKGYNDFVAAGIIGNMMTECGGHTLNLNYVIYGGKNNSYYGLCQWYKGYSTIYGAGLQEQCEYLEKTIRSEFKTFGYKSGYTYSAFCQIQNEQTAALAFAKTYERCESSNYRVRQVDATKALKYFTNY